MISFSKKAFILFIISSLLLSFSSCKEKEYNREYDEAAVVSAAEELIKKSIVLNDILYGKGIEYIDDETDLIYKKANKEYLEELGISSIEDIRAMMREVFSSKYIESVEKSDIFSPLVDDDVTVSYARYYETEEENGEKTIFVNSVYNYALKNPYEYVSSVRALKSVGEFVVVSATVRAVRSDGKVRNFDHEIKLIEESGGWRLATATYVVYNEYTDIYEELNK